MLRTYPLRAETAVLRAPVFHTFRNGGSRPFKPEPSKFKIAITNQATAINKSRLTADLSPEKFALKDGVKFRRDVIKHERNSGRKLDEEKKAKESFVSK